MNGQPPISRWRIAVRDDTNLNAGEKFVALTLSTFMNGAGHGWPSKRRIAAACGFTTRGVDGIVNRLEAAGYLVVERSNGRHANGYAVRFPRAGKARA